MTPEQYADFDATGLAELVARGETTPEELARIAAEAVRRLDRAIHGPWIPR